MAARRQIEAHKRIAGLHQGHEGALIGLAAGIGLHIREPAIEQPAGALDREVLGDIDELAAAVVAPAGIAFRVFVGEHRALRLEHRPRDDVFRRDEFDPVALPAELDSMARAISGSASVREAEKNEFERTDAGAETFIGGPSINRG